MRNQTHIEQYTTYMESRTFSPHTIDIRTRGLTKFNKWLTSRNFFFTDVIEEDIAEYKDSLLERYASSTAATHLTTVKSFYTWMHDKKKILINPTEGLVTNIATDKLPFILSVEEITKLFDSLPVNHPTSKRNRAMLEIAYSSLLRRNELVNLKLSDFNFKTQTLTVIRKQKKHVKLPYGSCSNDALMEYIDNERGKLLKGKPSNDLWITSKTAQKISYASVDDIFIQIEKTTGIKLTAHCLRRSGASHLLVGGASLAVVQDMLSHTTMKALKHYLRLNTADLYETLKKSEALK